MAGGGQCCFNAEDTSWGHDKFISLTKLHAKGRGFLVKNKLTIVAELHVLPEGNVSIAAPLSLSSKDETQADEKAEDADLVDDGASEEATSEEWVTDDDGLFEEDVENDDVPSSCLDDGGGDMSPLDQSNAFDDAETEVFNEFDFSPSQVRTGLLFLLERKL